MDREIRDLMREARRRELDGLDRARFLLRAGVTIPEYARFERRRTLRLLAAFVAIDVLAWAVCSVMVGRPMIPW